MFEGEQITPKLRLLRLLGREGRSNVWFADDQGRGKVVVVKLHGRSLPRNSSALSRLLREAEVAAQIKSPHVATILEHGISGSGMPYLVTERIIGKDLRERLKREGPMPPHEVARLICHLAKGLGKAHQLGLVHRNVKPSNVMLAEGGEDGGFCAKLLDLGLSKHAGESGPSQSPSGSLLLDASSFMSPEQLFGVRDVDFRADLWSLAVIAYYALTGKPPFDGKNIDELGKSLQDGRFELPSVLVPSLPGGVDAWFEKALQRDPGARFTSAKDLADGLERVLLADGERTSRTSYPTGVHASGLTERRSSPGGPASRRFMQDPEISERVVGPPRSVRSSGLTRGSVTEIVTVEPVTKRGSALLIAALAVCGIAAIGVGFSLLSGPSRSTKPVPATPLSGHTTPQQRR
jgi:eukaryotic-like serine/threonine-protein kinase